MPVFLLLVLCLVASYATESSGAVVDYPIQPVTRLADVAGGRSLWFAPCNASTPSSGDHVLRTAQLLTAATGVQTTCFATVPAMLAAFRFGPDGTSASVLGGVAVTSFNTTAAPFFTYTLHMDAHTFAPGAGSVATTAPLTPEGLPVAPDTTGERAYVPYLLPLQAAVEAAAAEHIVAGNATSAQAAAAAAPWWPWARTALFTRPFPALGVEAGAVSRGLALAIPIFLTVVFTLQVRVALVSVLEEKEARLLVLMRQMGLGETPWWLATLVTQFAKNIVLLTAVALAAVYGGLLPRATFTLVWVLFILFEVTVVGFSVAASALFSTSSTGGVIGMAIYILLAVPSYSFLASGMTAAPKIVLSLLAPFCFTSAISVITKSGTAGIDMTWVRALDASASPVGVSLAAFMGMMALDAVLYCGVAWYLHRVVGGEGQAQPRHPCYCLGFKRRAKRADGTALTAPGGASKTTTGSVATAGAVLEPALAAELDAVAAGTDNGSSGVIARGLTKTYPHVHRKRGGRRRRRYGMKGEGAADEQQQPADGGGSDEEEAAAGLPAAATKRPNRKGQRTVVDDLHLALREGQVTCLLGGNGAGKTTTIGMLTGLVQPTSGDAVLFGHSVISGATGAAASGTSSAPLLGVCPQENVIWPLLTVEEHLEFFAGELARP